MPFQSAAALEAPPRVNVGQFVGAAAVAASSSARLRSQWCCLHRPGSVALAPSVQRFLRRGLTLPSRGRSKGRFAPFGPPLMSNVRHRPRARVKNQRHAKSIARGMLPSSTLPRAEMKHVPPKLQPWFDARRRFKLTNAEVQMARELGMNPKKFGSLANERQEPWKAPLKEFIASCYRKSFGRSEPQHVFSLEDVVAKEQARREERREKRQAVANQASRPLPSNESLVRPAPKADA